MRNGAIRKAPRSFVDQIFRPGTSNLSSGIVTTVNVFYYRVQVLVMMRGFIVIEIVAYPRSKQENTRVKYIYLTNIVYRKTLLNITTLQ